MKRSVNINQILALFIMLFVVTAFSACSDVAGPNDGANENTIISQENDNFSDARRRAIAAAEAAAESEGCGVLETSPGDLALQYVDFKNEDQVGNISYTIEGSILTITFNGFSGAGVQPGENWSFDRTAVYVGSSLDGITSGGGSLKAINQFPYVIEIDSHPTTTTTHVIDLNNHPDIVEGGSFVMVTHGDAGILNSNGTMPTGGASRKSVYSGNEIGGKQGNLFKYLGTTYPGSCAETGVFAGGN